MASSIREEVLRSIKDYFAGEQWRTLQDRVENDRENSYHAHIFVDTSLHPLTFCDVLRTYYAAIGMPIDRAIDLQPSNVGFNMLHGIHPAGSFHYDVAWRYNPACVLAPMPHELVKEKNNLQIWGRKEIDDFFGQYRFVRATGQAKEDLDAFFRSPEWDQTVEYVLDTTIAHFHTNVEMSIHPDDLRDAALEAIGRQGWKLQKHIHCIFSPYKGWTTGKVVFLLEEPEVMFDIAWKFNPDVTIRPSTVHFMLQDSTVFDVRRKEKIEFYTSGGEFIVLSDDELRELGGLLKR